MTPEGKFFAHSFGDAAPRACNRRGRKNARRREKCREMGVIRFTAMR